MLTFYEMVGQRIIERLNELNLTQQNLADKLKISKQVMSKILNGEKKTTILEIRNIADNLTVSIDKLLNPVEHIKAVINIENNFNLQPKFMGRISTGEGKSGVQRAIDIIDTIIEYEDDYENMMNLRNKRIDFSTMKKKRKFDPNI
ncbi:MAG: helix-turn-helix domain-containing protein [Clostridium sp.]